MRDNVINSETLLDDDEDFELNEKDLNEGLVNDKV